MTWTRPRPEPVPEPRPEPRPDARAPAGRGPTMVARSSGDLVAMVPVVLGFEPTESVTLLTFEADRAFHARVDLPDDPAHDTDVVEALLEPARRHGVRRAAVVVHSRRPERFVQVARPLLDALLGAGVGVADVLRADGRVAWCLDCHPDGRPAGPCAGHPYDATAHRFTVQAVVEGRVLHRSREELAGTLAPVAGARHDAVRQAALAHGHRLAAGPLGREATWVRRTLRRHLTEGSVPGDVVLGRLLADLEVVALRDPVWEGMGRDEAERHVELWRDVVRRAPDELCAPAAGVLAFAAWLAGHGALAWCAVDRGRATGRDTDLLAFVAELLVHAIPPADDAARSAGPRAGADTGPGAVG